MKRLHVNIQVKDLEKSILFYQQLFNAEPTVQKADYAKWMLEDPKVNFAISLSDKNEGIEHLGIQAESEEELGELYGRLDKIEGKQFQEGETICCYSKSHKSWIEDPQGVEWEVFRTFGSSDTNKGEVDSESSCCVARTTEEVANS